MQKSIHRKYFTIQWHITSKCDLNCFHCYIHNQQINDKKLYNDLNYMECKTIIDDICETFKQLDYPFSINFTGGDPLLRKDFLDILDYCYNKSINIGILGNPNHINYDTARTLKEKGVINYQLSLDGLENTHDNIRGRIGAFRETLDAIDILNSVGIRTHIMFTVSKRNIHELIEVIDVAINQHVYGFDFARLVPTCEKKDLLENIIPPDEYRNLLLDVFDKYNKSKNTKVKLGKKDPLWTLLLTELGIIDPMFGAKGIVYSGCAAGCNIITIDSDGTVYPCRRLPIKIGKVPLERFWDIYVNSEEFNKIRSIASIQKCNKCNLLYLCRGCRGVAFGISGNLFNHDPQCWKEV